MVLPENLPRWEHRSAPATKRFTTKRVAGAAVLVAFSMATVFSGGPFAPAAINSDIQPQENVHRSLWKVVAREMLQFPDRLLNGRSVRELEDAPAVFEVSDPMEYWFGLWTREKLCHEIKDLTGPGVSALWVDQPTYVDAGKPAPIMRLQFDCENLVNVVGARERLGIGQFLIGFYATRMIAAMARIDLEFTCTEGRAHEKDNVLPWLNGYYPAPAPTDPWPFDDPVLDEAYVCSSNYYLVNRFDPLGSTVRDDMRRMAVALVGARTAKHEPYVSQDFPTPVFPGVELDDVAIHFRCGDILGHSRSPDHGVIQFESYAPFISPEARTIGVVTHPYEEERNRPQDRETILVCKTAVNLLVDTLQNDFPDAKVSVRNGVTDTIPVSFARIVMANQTFISPSAFGLFPFIGTFGTGYYEDGDANTVRPYLRHLTFPNIHKMNVPLLHALEIHKMGAEKALEWMVGYDEDEDPEMPLIEDALDVADKQKRKYATVVVNEEAPKALVRAEKEAMATSYTKRTHTQKRTVEN